MMRFKMRLMIGGGLLAGALLTGCSGLGKVPPAAQQLDLGAPAPVTSTQVKNQVLPALVLPPLAAANMLQGVSVIWRLGEDGSPNSYATYEWSTSPESLVRESLIFRLSADFAVLPASVDSDDLVLRVNLRQFEQVFSPDGTTNHGVVSFQAVLLRGNRVLGQYRDTVSVQALHNDAPAGAVALRAATIQMGDKLTDWIKSVESPRNSKN